MIPAPAITSTTSPTPVSKYQGSEGRSAVVEVRLRINADFSQVAGDIEGFKSNLSLALSQSAGVDDDRVLVRSIFQGSVIVDLIMLDRPAGAESVEPAAAVAVQTLEAKLEQKSITWPPPLQAVMAGGASIEAKAIRTMPMSSLEALKRSGDATIYRTPIPGWSPPVGCSCVEGLGVTSGCAEHKQVKPPWCLVNAECQEAMGGSWGIWAWCRESSTSSGREQTSYILRTASTAPTQLAPLTHIGIVALTAASL